MTQGLLGRYLHELTSDMTYLPGEQIGSCLCQQCSESGQLLKSVMQSRHSDSISALGLRHFTQVLIVGLQFCVQRQRMIKTVHGDGVGIIEMKGFVLSSCTDHRLAILPQSQVLTAAHVT